jgi:hypothetical protein
MLSFKSLSLYITLALSLAIASEAAPVAEGALVSREPIIVPHPCDTDAALIKRDEFADSDDPSELVNLDTEFADSDDANPNTKRGFQNVNKRGNQFKNIIKRRNRFGVITKRGGRIGSITREME